MFYDEIKPSPRLSRYIKCYWILQDNSGGSKPAELILPDGSPEIVFNLGMPFQRHYFAHTEVQPRSIVVGQISSHISIQATQSVDLFGIRFHPSGLYPLLRSPLNEFTDRIESLDTVFGRFGKEIEEEIFLARSAMERILILEKSLSRSYEHPANGVLISAAIDIIQANHGVIKVESLTKCLGTNWKALQRNFHREIGVSPKLFCRITRLQNVLRSMSGNRESSWADIAYTYGYVDQAHFINDFRDFSGLSPNAYVKQQTSMSDSFVG
ncbi:MAG: helix-turn-helix domain-containing protein [Pyrinomonadaceae bacterium]